MRVVAFTFALSIQLISAAAYGQASLAAENIIDDVKVKIGQTIEVYTLFRDARNEDQWYYVPNRPRLVEQTVEDGVAPVFSLIRYQFPDPADKAKLVEEGILQFASTLAAPAAALSEFQAQIKKKTQKDGARVSAIPFKAADVALYSYPTGEGGKSRLLSANPYGSGLAPLFASQNMVFSIPLSKMGTDVLDTMVNGNTGLPVTVTFTFNALTPPAGFKVTVDFSQLYSHYSKDEKFRVAASYYGWFGASYEKSVQQIREELMNSKAIKVESITGEQFPLDQLDKYLQPVLARINSELIESAKPPAEVAPAVASQPSGGGWFGGGGYSVAIKDVTKVKKSIETWDMRIQQIVERKTVAQGFIGIGSYSENVRKRAVTLVPGTQFKSAYVMLPLPAIADELDITSIDLQVALKSSAGVITNSQVVQWSPGGKWRDIGGADRSVLAFALTEAFANDPNFKNSKFVTKINVTTPRQNMQVESISDAFDGQKAMPGINQSLFDVVEINGLGLPFKGLTPAGDLLAANIALKLSGATHNLTLRPKSINGVLTAPEPVRMLIPAGTDAKNISAQITFQTTAGPKKWARDGKSFGSEFSGTAVYLLDSDIVKN